MRNKKGFTLIEVIIVLVIISLIAAILIPNIVGYIDRASDKSCEKAYDNLFSSVESDLSKKRYEGIGIIDVDGIKQSVSNLEEKKYVEYTLENSIKSALPTDAKLTDDDITITIKDTTQGDERISRLNYEGTISSLCSNGVDGKVDWTITYDNTNKNLFEVSINVFCDVHKYSNSYTFSPASIDNVEFVDIIEGGEIKYEQYVKHLLYDGSNKIFDDVDAVLDKKYSTYKEKAIAFVNAIGPHLTTRIGPTFNLSALDPIVNSCESSFKYTDKLCNTYLILSLMDVCLPYCESVANINSVIINNGVTYKPYFYYPSNKDLYNNTSIHFNLFDDSMMCFLYKQDDYLTSDSKLGFIDKYEPNEAYYVYNNEKFNSFIVSWYGNSDNSKLTKISSYEKNNTIRNKIKSGELVIMS